MFIAKGKVVTVLLLLCIFLFMAEFSHVNGESLIQQRFATRNLLQSDTVSEEDRDGAQGYIDTWRSLPRYVYFTNDNTLDQLEPGFCAPDANGECRLVMYGESVGLVTIPSLVMALLALACCPAFWLCRFCCCGGCYPSHGVCFPGERFDIQEGDGYSRKSVIALKIIVAVLFLLAMIFVVIGSVGQDRFGTSIDNIGSTAVDTANNLSLALTDIVAQFQQLQSLGVLQQDISNELSVARDYSDTLVQYADEIRVDVARYNQIRGGVMIGAFVLSAVIFVIPVVAAILPGLHKLVWISAFLGFIGMFLMWLTFSIHYPIAVVLGDVCYKIEEVELAAANRALNPTTPPTTPIPTNATTTAPPSNTTTAPSNTTTAPNTTGPALPEFEFNVDQIFELIAGCGLTQFSSFRDLATDALTASIDEGCSGIRSYCNLTFPCENSPILPFIGINDTVPVSFCPATNCTAIGVNPDNCTVQTIRNFYVNNNMTDFLVGCPSFIAINDSNAQIATPEFAVCDATANVTDICINLNSTYWFTYGALLNSSTWACRNRQVPIRSCRTTGCISQEAKDVSILLTKGFDGLSGFEAVLSNNIDPLLRCDPISQGVDTLLDELCVSMISSLFLILLASAFLGVLFIAGIITSILALKRFNSENRRPWEGNDR